MRSMSINEAQDDIIEEFSFFEDWMDKYEHIIELGKELEGIDAAHMVEENLVKGCQSKVWLTADMQGDTLTFAADSDAIITKGLVALMIRVLSGNKPEDIMHADLYFVDRIGLKEHLSPTRSNGLVSMIKKMKLYAIAHHAKAQS